MRGLRRARGSGLRWLLAGVLVAVPALAPAQGTGARGKGAKGPPAEEPGDMAPADAPAPVVVKREGDYGGVVPGRAPAPGRAKRKKGGKPTVTWVGFQPLDAGAARVFVQLDAPASFEQRVVGDELVVTIPGARLNTRNNGRPLDASYFDTRVARVHATAARGRGRRGGAGVEIRVQFKKGGATQADARLEMSQDGAHYLFLDFGP